ncbi:MAG: hypothetical protein HOC18_04025 [Candidatus Marinimicrobia bacterium]|jgi:hypothetical protein|nr:hypothetical protein [Candidatus Neomarinimicrobiota bacterium]
MGFQVSPGVNVTEKDLTNVIPAVATTTAGIAGTFRWGPVGKRITVDSENNLVDIFWKPDTSDSSSYFHTAANYLGYGNNLEVVRVAETGAYNASSDGATNQIKDKTDFDDGINIAYAASEWIARYPGALGNSLQVQLYDGDGKVLSGMTAAAGYTGAAGARTTFDLLTASPLAGDDRIILGNDQQTAAIGKGDTLRFSGGQDRTVRTAVGTGGAGTTAAILFDPVLEANLDLGHTFDVISKHSITTLSGPATTTQWASDLGVSGDEVHVLVIDEDGDWTGVSGSVLERFENLSLAGNAKNENGANNYYKDVINEQSSYIYAYLGVTLSGAGSSAAGETVVSGNVFGDSATFSWSLSAGEDGTTAANEALLFTQGYNEWEDAETVDVSLLLGGPAEGTVSKLLVDICDRRKDCVAFLSPPKGAVVNKTATQAQGLVRDYRLGLNASNGTVDYSSNNLNVSSSYAMLDSGWKYQYDKYNDRYMYVPLNGDIAGLCTRTEQNFDAWWPPAGFNRGQIRGVVRLAHNPRKAHRDNLYKDQINPVVSFPGEGVVLFGDKTLQSKPSAFDRINVRRLFIVLEKAIATAAKYQLFELNDQFTRSQFKSMIVPFLRDIQSRRGITDFMVVCDDTNNPGSVVDRNEFVADIYVKPTRSINFIQLNFIATRTGVDFSEVVGA